ISNHGSYSTTLLLLDDLQFKEARVSCTDIVDPLATEAYACEIAIKMMKALGLDHGIIIGDSKTTLDCLNYKQFIPWKIEHTINEIQAETLSMGSVSFLHVNCHFNKSAHETAQ
ncbi:hypothetical protein Ancab_008310, partial [Ancistrocladus abbreviatus]